MAGAEQEHCLEGQHHTEVNTAESCLFSSLPTQQAEPPTLQPPTVAWVAVRKQGTQEGKLSGRGAGGPKREEGEKCPGAEGSAAIREAVPS